MDGFPRSERRRLAAVCSIAATVAVISLLWLLRTRYFNATNAGWGDREQDRHQWLLGWGVRVSFVATVICICATAAFSRRVLIAMSVGTALSILSVLMALGSPISGFILGFPGAVAALYTFGIHNGGGSDVATFSGVINVVAYGGITYLLLHKKTMQ